MIILKLKDGTEEWVEKFHKETIDGVNWFIFEAKTKAGKPRNGAYVSDQIVGYIDVGEKEKDKKEAEE